MKKFLAILIGGLFLSLASSQAGFADARSFTDSNDHKLFQQWEKSPSLASFLLFNNKDFALIHFPFIRSEHTIASQELSEYFPFVGALLTAKDVLWAELTKWSPAPSFKKTEMGGPIKHTISRPFDSSHLTAEEHMGISLNHELGSRKMWNVCLDLGIAFQNNHSIPQEFGIPDDSFPSLAMGAGEQGEDFFDQLRNASPFIGFGIYCKF
jgi:hypothetical protein